MSRTSSEGAASVSVHVVPPFVVRASEPPVPYANAVDAFNAATALKLPGSAPPIGTNDVPAAVDTTVVPFSPTATTWSAAGSAIALIAAVAGDTESHDPPPFLVRT